MELHRTDEERLESLKNWWSEHGRTLIAGVVLGLAGVSGWTFWLDYEHGRAETASVLFQTMSEAAASGDHAAVREAGSALLADHGGSGYAVAGSLLVARSELLEDRIGEAIAHFRWVIDHAELPELRDVARLRLAEANFAAGALDEAMTLLDETTTAPFTAARDELRGDVHFARGESGKAREAWERAAAGYTDSPAGAQRVTLKLDDLGHLNTP
ncbi:MAG: tetratricopeptide repeat protein [Immundisolibacterales bacterium]|nr:tetratricopeptide repeat protein [Immundisolibacterales bacterium]